MEGGMRGYLTTLSVCMLLAVAAGCMSPKCDGGCTYIEVKATADGTLVLDGQTVDCATFVKKVQFNKDSDMVSLMVAQDSLAPETTVKELVDELNKAGYQVTMQAGSKYVELGDYCQKKCKQ